MRRHALGIIAIGLLAIGLLWPDDAGAAFAGACLRVAPVLALLWLAWPQLETLPLWLVAVFGVVLLLVLRWPKLLWAALPLAALLWLLRPRAPRGTTERRP
jgi:hypothetical protein